MARGVWEPQWPPRVALPTLALHIRHSNTPQPLRETLDSRSHEAHDASGGENCTSPYGDWTAGFPLRARQGAQPKTHGLPQDSGPPLSLHKAGSVLALTFAGV